MMRIATLSLLAATTFFTASCSAPMTGTPETAPTATESTQPESSEPPSTAEPSTSATEASVEQTQREFLNVVCYTDTALQNLIAAANAAGGWGDLSKADARTYSSAASSAAQEAVRRMQSTTWPASISANMEAVETEYLAMLRPLEQIGQSTKADERSQAWRALKSQDRTAEQQVRLTLGLQPVDSADDGCPPPVAVKPAKKPEKNDNSSNAAAAAGWTDHWTSPSGNIKCGYNPAGSRGTPVVACVVSDENTYMKLTDGVGVEGPKYADSSIYSQLSVNGARVLRYGQTTYVGPFTCTQSPADGIGMSCWNNSTLRGFTVKRGTYWPY